MANFRPNIVVRGVKQPWDEDNWGKIVISPQRNPANHSSMTGSGSESSLATAGAALVHMAVVKPCSRCQIPNLDPNTGIENPDKEPNKTLKSFHCGHHMNLKTKKFHGEVSVSLLLYRWCDRHNDFCWCIIFLAIVVNFIIGFE